MDAPELLDSLLRTPGPSGHEAAVAAVWRAGVRDFCAEVQGDRMGSSVGRVAGTAGGPSLAVIGHIDEIGVHITHIDDEGYLRFGEVGGWDPIQLVGQRVRIVTRAGEVRGVLGRKPIHLIRGDERDRAPKLKDLHIDIGATDGDEARGLVRIGDAGVIDADPLPLPNGRIVSRALDNRIGAYVAAEVARRVAGDGGAPGDVLACAVTQEETTLAGARTSAFGLDPGLAIVVDVTHATDQPGVELGQTTKHPLGSGPVIARGVSLHPVISELLLDTAAELGIPHTVESIGRSTGSDADSVFNSRSGIPTGLVSVPLRYMHSSVELAALSDIDGAAALIAAAAQRIPPDTTFER